MIRIMIIDDSETVHIFIKKLLKGTQTELVSSMNGRDALANLEKDKKFDLILLDWEMPVLDGPGTLNQLAEKGFSIPVIMLTSKNSISDIEQILALGVKEYIMKPFTFDILGEKIEMTLGKKISNAS